MEQEIIQKSGLTKSQAATYLALLQGGAMAPAELAGKTGETRTNTYAILNRLEELGLVLNIGESKSKFRATNPANLEILAEKRRKAITKNERDLKDNMSVLLDIFYAHNEAPGSKTLIGEEGIKEVHRDVIATGETVHLIRTIHDSKYYDLIKVHREKRRNKGIHTIALTPDNPHGRQSMASGKDDDFLVSRTMMPEDAYNSPVEIMIYGPKVAFISYGEEEIVTIITSPAISVAFKEIFFMLQKYWQQNYK